MRTARVISPGGLVCERCEVAATPWARTRGLIGRASLEPGGGLLLRPAFSIHTMFMRFAIDAVFCDRDLRVLEIRSHLRPWRSATVRGAGAVLELPAGRAGRVALLEGERLALEPLRR